MGSSSYVQDDALDALRVSKNAQLLVVVIGGEGVYEQSEAEVEKTGGVFLITLVIRVA